MVAGILVIGAVNTGAIALLAVGFSLIYGAARIINLAHTAFYMVASYIIFTFIYILGWNPASSAILSILCTTLLGMGVYKLLLDRIREHENTILMITIAIAMAFQQIMLVVFRGTYRGIPAFIPGYSELFGVRVLNQYLMTLGIALIALLIVWAFLSRTNLGISIRAASQDREAASLMGIDVGRVCLVTMGISVALAAIAGAIMAPLYALEPGMWMDPLVTIIAAVVLGGLGSLKGSVAGAAILAYTQTFVAFVFPEGSFLKTAVALAVVVIVLLVRPEGLFGVVFEEERL
jgi:branched-chain amino acid transport system permease protein